MRDCNEKTQMQRTLSYQMIHFYDMAGLRADGKVALARPRAPPRHSDPLDLCRFFVLCNMHAAALGCTSTLFSFSFFVAGRRGKAEEAGRQRESIKKVRKTGVVVCTEGTGKAKINVKKLSLFPFACKRNIRVSIKKDTWNYV